MPVVETAAGRLTWEQVTGAQGTVTHVHSLTASTPPARVTSYYLDDSTPSTAQCTGDAFAYGSSGPYTNSNIPCTDPAHGCTDTLKSTRTMYFDPPGGTAATAAAEARNAGAPLRFTTAPVEPVIPTSVGTSDDSSSWLIRDGSVRRIKA